ncbi:MAG: hypothetical protein ABW128_06995 [Rhizorhabdus sp.]
MIHHNGRYALNTRKEMPVSLNETALVNCQERLSRLHQMRGDTYVDDCLTVKELAQGWGISGPRFVNHMKHIPKFPLPNSAGGYPGRAALDAMIASTQHAINAFSTTTSQRVADQTRMLEEAARRPELPALPDDGAIDGSSAQYLKIDESDLMSSLREVLLQFSTSDLAKIGVTIKREEGEWTWLRDAFTVALEREGREKAAATIRGNDMSKSCSIGVSKSFLIELAKLIDERNGDDGKVERMRAACIAEVRAMRKYEGSDHPVCNSIIHSIEAIDAGEL